MWFKHKGCISPIVEYVGTQPLEAGTAMRSSDWVFDVGIKTVYGGIMPIHPKHGTHIPAILCPDCNQRIGIHPSCLEKISK